MGDNMISKRGGDNVPNKLKNMNIREVSGVTKGANRKQWLIVKSDDKKEGSIADISKIAIEALQIAIKKTMEEYNEPDDDAIAKMEGGIKTCFDQFVDFIKTATTGTFKQNMGRRTLRETLWGATDALFESIQVTLNDQDLEDGKKASQVESNLDQFTTWMLDQLDLYNEGEEVTKAGAVISASRLERLRETHSALGQIIAEAEKGKDEPDKGGVQKGDDIEVNAEEITKMVEAAIAPIVERLESLEKHDDPGTEDKVEDKMTQAVTDAITKAMEPIAQRLEVIEKAKGIKKSIDGQGDPEPVTKSFWGGLL
jgi:hypothetical protein